MSALGFLTFCYERRPRMPAGVTWAAGHGLVISFTLTLACFLLSCSPKNVPPIEGRTIIDELGRTIVVAGPPQRIVSLAPSITETLFALGVGQRIAGVTTYCDYPPEAREKERIGDTLRPNLEKIVALKADLVIMSTSSQLEQSLVALEGLGVRVYVSNPRNLEGVLDSIGRIGELVDARDRARELTTGLRARIETVETKLAGGSRPSVFFILGTDPLITVGRETFIDDLMTRAGGRSISANAGGEYPQFSLESALAGRPEVIFVQFAEKQLPTRLSETPASRNGRVYHLDDDLVSRPGPRLLDGLEQMAARIHPEVSWK